MAHLIRARAGCRARGACALRPIGRARGRPSLSYLPAPGPFRAPDYSNDLERGSGPAAAAITTIIGLLAQTCAPKRRRKEASVAQFPVGALGGASSAARSVVDSTSCCCCCSSSKWRSSVARPGHNRGHLGASAAPAVNQIGATARVEIILAFGPSDFDFHFHSAPAARADGPHKVAARESFQKRSRTGPRLGSSRAKQLTCHKLAPAAPLRAPRGSEVANGESFAPLIHYQNPLKVPL